MKNSEQFPKELDFFQFGEIKAVREDASLKTQFSAAILFEVSGDERGLCVVVFNALPKALTYDEKNVEIANILSSKFVDQRAERLGIYLALSPPVSIQKNEPQYRHVYNTLSHSDFAVGAQKDDLSQTYVYSEKDSSGTDISVKMRLTYIKTVEGNA